MSPILGIPLIFSCFILILPSNSQLLRRYSLVSLWNTKGLARQHLFPTHDSSVRPGFVGIPTDGYSTVHLLESDLKIPKTEYRIHSVCPYRHLNTTFYAVNTALEKGRSIVSVDLSLDELKKKMEEMTELRIKPSFVCVGPTGETFSAVWHPSVDRLRHFEIKLRPLEEMRRMDEEMGSRGYYVDNWQVFRANRTTMVLAIWRKGFGVRYRVQYGMSLDKMSVEMNGSDMLPYSSSNLPRSKRKDRVQYWIIWRGDDFKWGNDSIPMFREGSKEQWAELDGIIQKQMYQYDIPSISLDISLKGVPIYTTAYGYKDLRSRKQVLPRDQYRVASISKTLTSMAVAQMVAKGKLSNERIVFGRSGILSEFPVHPFLWNIRVKPLMEHSSGGWSHFMKMEFNRNETSREELLKSILKDYIPSFPPGKVFLYSNIGYVILGQIIEKISGISYEGFVRQHILQPLGINGSIGQMNSKPNEVFYYSQDNANPYQHWNPSLLAAAAGWTLSAHDVSLIFAHLESGMNNIYAPLVRRSFVSNQYGRGVQLGSDGSLYHLGSLAGTEAIGYTRRGIQVSILSNMRGKEHNVHTMWMLELCQRIANGLEAKRMKHLIL